MADNEEGSATRMLSTLQYQSGGPRRTYAVRALSLHRMTICVTSTSVIDRHLLCVAACEWHCITCRSLRASCFISLSGVCNSRRRLSIWFRLDKWEMEISKYVGTSIYCGRKGNILGRSWLPPRIPRWSRSCPHLLSPNERSEVLHTSSLFASPFVHLPGVLCSYRGSTEWCGGWRGHGNLGCTFHTAANHRPITRYFPGYFTTIFQQRNSAKLYAGICHPLTPTKTQAPPSNHSRHSPASMLVVCYSHL